MSEDYEKTIKTLKEELKSEEQKLESKKIELQNKINKNNKLLKELDELEAILHRKKEEYRGLSDKERVMGNMIKKERGS